ncbi:MAG: 4-(cytidine 5'-diphospho)-2-C-methyl-D-erythritol kinase, partial [Microcystaceae cyanobacterium]
LDTEKVKSRTTQVHLGPLVNAILHKDGTKIGQLLHNDLEKVVLPEFPQVAQLREAFQEAGGLGTMMSGSGPAVFTLCESQGQAESITEQVTKVIPDPDLEFWVTRLCSTGIQVGTSHN